MAVVMQSGMVLIREGAVVEGCAGCPTMAFVFQYLVSGGGPFISGTLTWSATAVGGVSPGWRFFSSLGQTVCDAGPNGPSLSLKEIVFWCDGATWQAEIVVLFNAIQDSYATIGGSLDPFTLFSASSPRSYTTRTPGESLSLCGSVTGSGHLLLGVVVVA